MNTTTSLLCCGLMLALLACGGADEKDLEQEMRSHLSPGDRGTQHAGSDGSDVEWDEEGLVAEILDLRFSPDPPLSQERLRVRVDVADPRHRPGDFSYEWRIAGQEISEDGPMIMLSELRKGEEVSVKVIYTNGSGFSDESIVSSRVANRPPRMRNLRLSRGTDSDGNEQWIAEVAGDDPDGDDLEFRFQWLINDEASQFEGKSIATGNFKRGDRVRVRVVAFDGDDESPPAESGTVTVANASPEIRSIPPRVGANGRFEYAIDAEDHDGDSTLRYELVVGPRGMEIDGETGHVAWTPELDQAGSHSVEIAVDDQHGGRATQEFILPIVVKDGVTDTTPAAIR